MTCCSTSGSLISFRGNLQYVPVVLKYFALEYYRFFNCLSTYLSAYLSIYLSTYLSAYLSICLSIYLSIYLSICLSIHLSVYLSIYLSVYLSIHLSVYLSIHLSVYLSIHLSVYLSVHLSVYLSIYLSTYLSIYLSICLSIHLSVCRYTFRKWLETFLKGESAACQQTSPPLLSHPTSPPQGSSTTLSASPAWLLDSTRQGSARSWHTAACE